MSLAEVFERVAGPDAGVEFNAFDGSRAGQPGSPGVRVTVRDQIAVRYLAQEPGGLGLARAYVAGHLDVDGDMHTALSRLVAAQRIDLSLTERLGVLSRLGGPGLLLRRVAPPPQEVRVNRSWLAGRGTRMRRDATAISHHYDVSNTFYEWVLGPSMAYTCACYPRQDATLEQAQDAQVRPGGQEDRAEARDAAARRRLRLGRHGDARGPASTGSRALGVTLSEQQALWAQRAIKEAGLEDLAEVRHLDYREVTETDFDAISSIGLTEHIGKAKPAALLRFPLRQAEAGRSAAQPLHHQAGQHRAGVGHRRVHLPVRFPRRRARRSRLPRLPDARRGIRGQA